MIRLLLVVTCLLFAASAEAQALLIDEIQVTGNRRSEADAVLRVLQTQKGQPLDRRTVSEDIRRIFRLGFYRDIKVDFATVNGKQVLTFQVLEKPSIRSVKFEGYKELSEDDIKEVVDVKSYAALDQAQVARNAEKIQDLYTEKGYFLAEVSWKTVSLENNEVDVVFTILEKELVKVKEFTIVGNKVLSDSDIKQRLETREDSFLGFLSGAGTYDKTAFERDQLRISQFYWDEGYVQARVRKPRVELSPDRSEIVITVSVEEGQRFKTGKIDLSGDFIGPKDELLKKVSLETGDWFSSARLRETMTAVGDVYKDAGYAYANVVPNTRVDETTQTVDLTIDIQKGKKVRIERIRIVGNQKTRDKVIRRELRIYEGEYFSSSGLRRSERLVNRLGFFEPGGVVFRTSRGSRDDLMEVVIEVKEKSTGTFQVGAGFSTLENFVAQAQISQNNLFGRGQSLSLQATISSIRSIANVRFADDYFLDSKVRFATNVYRFETNYENFARTSLGGDITLGYPLNDDWSVAGTYTLEEVGVDSGGYGNTEASDPLVDLYGRGVTSSLRGSVFYDTRNNRLFPSSVLYTGLSAQPAACWFISDNVFAS